MRYFTILLLFFFVLRSEGQDSTKHSGRSSVSFTYNTNIVYKGINPYSYITQYSFGSLGAPYPYYHFEITPLTSVNPCIDLAYSYVFHKGKHLSLAINVGASYVQYTYKFTAKGWDNSFPEADSGTFQAQEQINVFELNLGISVNYNITDKLSWHNEIVFIKGLYPSKLPAISTDAPGGLPIYLITVYYQGNNNGAYTYLFYKTGIEFKLSPKFDLMPELSIPLCNATSFPQNSWNLALPTVVNLENNSDIYRSLRTGITLTYNF